MSTPAKSSGPQKLLGEIHLARLHVSRARSVWDQAAEDARLARRRRKEAKEAARRARKIAKAAKREFAEAEEALAVLEQKHTVALEQQAQERKLARFKVVASAGRSTAEKSKSKHFLRAVRTQPTRQTVEKNTAPVAALSGVSLKSLPAPVRKAKPPTPKPKKRPRRHAAPPVAKKPVQAVPAPKVKPISVPRDFEAPAPASAPPNHDLSISAPPNMSPPDKPLTPKPSGDAARIQPH